MSSSLLRDYELRYRDILVPAAKSLEALICNHLQSATHVDRISARAKIPQHFIEKASRLNSDGSPKYSDPLAQIQDQIGARVVVFYNGDVAPTGGVLMKYFRRIEERVLVPDSEWKFGYFGKHYILALPGDVVPKTMDPAIAPRFFELQIKTLFQHAWSEANHDLGYKPPAALNDDQTRRLAFTAAEAWGADRVFQELFEELRVVSGSS